jgi:hypothetical protein
MLFDAGLCELDGGMTMPKMPSQSIFGLISQLRQMGVRTKIRNCQFRISRDAIDVPGGDGMGWAVKEPSKTAKVSITFEVFDGDQKNPKAKK